MALSIGSLVGFIRADSSGMQRGLSDAELRMRGFQRDTEGRLRHLDGRFATTGELMAAGLAEGTNEGRRFGLSLRGIGGAVGGLAGVIGSIGGIVAKLGAAVPLAAGLAATVANIAPASAVAVTGLLAIQQATMVVKLGTQGMGDALKNAMDPENAEAFEEALKKLSPSAQAFARQVKALAPQWKTFQQGIQEELFRGLADNLKVTAKSVLPVLQKELKGTATALGDMAAGVLGAARDLADSGTLGKAMRSATTGLKNLQGVPGMVVTGLGQLAAAAGPSFEVMTSAAAHGMAQVSRSLDGAFKSGALQGAIENAISLIGDLFDVAANVGSVIGSIFSAAQTSGGGFIGTLKEITGSLADAFASPAVQDGLKALFSTMSVLAQTAAPLLGQALAVVGPVLTALGPPVQTLIKALGDALSPIIKALGPVLVAAATAVGALVTALSPLLPVVGDLIASLLPPLVPILTTLAGAFVALAPVISQIAKGLGDTLKPILDGLGKVLVQLVNQGAKMFMLALQQLLPVLPSVIQLGVQLGKSLGEILTAVAPLLPQIMMLSTQLVVGLLPAIVPLLPPLIKLATLFIRLATGVITSVVVPALSGLIKFLAGMQAAFQPAIAAVTWLVDKIIGLFRWLYNVLVGHSIIPDMINAIVRWFTGLPGRAVAALSNLGSRIASVASSAMRSLGNAIGRGVSAAVSYVRGLPGRARSALGNLGGYLWNAGASLINGFINGIRSKVGEVASAARNVVSAARDFFPFSPAKRGPFSGRGYTSYSGRALIAGFQRGIAEGTPGLRAQLQNLPGMPGMGLGAGMAAGGGGRSVLEIRGDGSRVSDLLVEVLREAVEVRGGGNVQRALGT